MVQVTDWQRAHVETGFYPPVTYLMIDDQHVEKLDRVQRIPGVPEKLPGQIITPKHPWEGQYVWAHNGLLYDEDEKLFKFWYHCNDPHFAARYPELRWGDRPAYAISKDGQHWHKPELGVVQWQDSKRNNLVDFPPYGGDGPLGSLFRNPDFKDRNRYLAMGMARFRTPRGQKPQYWYDGAGYQLRRKNKSDVPITCGFYVYHSPDGFKWNRRTRHGMSNTICTDNMMAHGYDPQLRQWIIWNQARTPDKFRTIGVSFTDDLNRIPFPQEILTPDDEDPPGCQFNHMVAQKVPGGYVGLVVDFRPHEGCKKEPQLAFSRDARSWTRPVGRAPFIPAGQRGQWDEMNVFAHNPVQVGDDVFIMYHGSITGNGSFFPEHRGSRTSYTKITGGWGALLPDGRLNLPGIGMAKLKRDRWAAVTPAHRVGVVHTNRMYWANRKLIINADACGGAIRAELRDHHGKPVPGFTLADSDPFTGNKLSHQMSWNGRRLLPKQMLGTAYTQPSVGRLISIRFHLERTKLYSFSC